ncbi:putative receptor protein kinase ZmPK1 isoform X1 [Benincasa hispida]|uniref:putative receptor protein kinase ZmPK1 isoform X1 n=2 Tax=Benincasa hispida TaxID=102211 RepID=UPI0018FF9E28|nr:putative receptor protein kinase ZmPK1 isoform X1 [Benincasa hispida]
MFLSFLFISSLLLAITTVWAAAPAGLQSLTPGNSIAVEVENQFLISPNGTFSSGFYPVGNNSYCYSIWYTNSFEKTVVWMANRDKPVNGEKSRLTLNVDSNLVLTDADGTVVWSTDTVSDGEIQLRLLETGNLVVMNQSQNFIWQSFDFPTDTLLPEQRFLKTSTLISMQNRGIYLSGFYYFKFNDYNVLNLLYNSPSLSGIYWPDTMVTVFVNGRSPYNSSRIAILNEMGGFESSDKLQFNATDYGLGPKRRLTVDFDGVLRLYSLNELTGNWTVTWIPSGARIDPCMVHGLCGDYGICEYDPLPACICPPGFIRNDPSDWTKGCKPLVNLTCNWSNSSKEMDFITLPNTDYFGHDWGYIDKVSIETCRNWCLSSCECTGFGYALDGSGQCYPKMALRNGYRKPGTAVIMFIKATKDEYSSSLALQHSTNDLNCSVSQIVLGTDHVYAEKSNKFRSMGLLIGVVAAIGISELIFVAFGWWNVFRKRVNEELVNMGYIVLAMGFKRFSYAELKRATKNFKQEIGKGGFGTVYKGELDDGRVVAVKRLDGVLQGDAEFWAEVSIIGKINHKNLVKLWGFCAEKQHKMLVYEYVKNGSLDKHLFSDSSQVLGLEQRYEIAVGTAKGLSYLHEECLEWVLHCDVKPQNILLDESLEPKVADFGMSKLCREINESGFSKVRGTRGYLAPEWMMNLKIDAKADIYSYGIVLLELLSGKNAYDFEWSTISKDGGRNTDMVKWVMEIVEKGEIERVMDPRLKVENNQNKKIEILLKVALLCVKEDRNMRPAMSRVVELLTGYEEQSPHRDDFYPKNY